MTAKARAAFVFVMIACSAPPPEAPPPSPRAVGQAIVVAKEGPIRIESRTAGRVVRVHVREGDSVREGQVLAELDDRSARSLAVQRRAELEMALASEALVRLGARPAERRQAALAVERARLEERMAERQEDRDERLAALTPAVSLEQRERVRHRLEDARLHTEEREAERQRVSRGPTRNDRAIASARVVVARELLAQAEIALEDMAIRSPLSGVVLARRIGPGDVIGSTPARVLFEVADPSRVELQIEFDEGDAHLVTVGAAVELAEPHGDAPVAHGFVERVGAAFVARSSPVTDVLVRADGRVLRAWVPLPEGAHRIGQRFDAVVRPDNAGVGHTAEARLR